MNDLPASIKDVAPSDDDIVIVSALRTPLAKSRKGAFVGVPAATLLQCTLEAVLKESNVSGSQVDDLCVGNVLLPSAGYASLRMAQIAAGIPATTALQTINRQCASGLQAISTIANAIQLGEIDIGIAAGVESMSANPMSKMKPVPVEWKKMPRTAMDCLLPMGITSDTVVKKFGLKRHELDEFAAASHRKAAAAQGRGMFDSEIVPVQVKDRLVTRDEGIRPQTTTAVLSKLRPAFTPMGATTAGNSSQTTDGAAAVLLTTRRRARELNLPIRAIWRGYTCKGIEEPSIMGIGPAIAIPAVLEATGLERSDIGVYEINEAFASQAAWCVSELGLNPDTVNPNGGAIALGHPLGCTGARMMASIIPELQRRKSRYGVISMCIGTGMGAAAVVELEPQSNL